MDDRSRIESNGSLDIARKVPPNADIVFAPIDAIGTPGRLNQFVLSHLGLDREYLPMESELSKGFAIRELSGGLLVFVVTVGTDRDTADNLRINLSAALRDLESFVNMSVWIPLMGTGAGGLSHESSLRITLNALTLARYIEHNWKVTVSVPTDANFDTEFLHDIRHLVLPANKPPFDELLEYAAAIATFRRIPGEISTTLLMFTLATANEENAPEIVTGSTEAKAFSQALRELAGDDFFKSWNSYFSAPPEEVVSNRIPYIDSYELSPNCSALVSDAVELASSKNRHVTIVDLLDSFGELKTGRYRKVLSQMQVDPESLFAEYARRRDSVANAVAARIVFEHLTHDHASHLDGMGFSQYAKAIATFLTSPQTQGPISISIQAPWGAGKSSLMRQVQHKLESHPDIEGKQVHAKIKDVLEVLNRRRDVENLAAYGEKKSCWTIWFNAWKYESSEQVWAGLVDAIVTQVSDRLPPHERELFLLRLNLARIDDGEVRKKIHERIFSFWWASAKWVLLAGGALISTLMWLIETKSGLLGGLALTSTGLLGIFGQNLTKIRNEPAKLSLSDYIKVPDYGKSVGVIHQIHGDLQRVISVLPKGKDGKRQPLVIFIDDLDRCSPNKVASIVEGINMLLASDQPEFRFVIGMDPQIVAAALEHAHKDIKGYLPSYDQSVPLGWRFMDKFIQLAFTIPPRRQAELDVFVAGLLQKRVNQGLENTTTVDPALASKPSRTLSTPNTSRKNERPISHSAQARVEPNNEETEDVLIIMSQIVSEVSCSPREIKRMLNFVRFALLMRTSRRDAGKRVPELALYQRWIILCMRWPDMARWLQWGADILTESRKDRMLDGVASRRLAILEDTAEDSQNDFTTWGANAARLLGLQPGKIHWLLDKELFDFFVRELAFPASRRLSHGASVGFY